MMLQEAIDFTDYFRCYSIDRCDVRIMQYDPKQPHHLRYVKNPKPVEETIAIAALIQAVVAKLYKLIDQNLGFRLYRNTKS